MDAAQDPDIIALYESISSNPMYLEGSEGKPFEETPLHKAASEGRTLLAVEILRLKPSLGKKLNCDGLSPLDLALHNGHRGTVDQLIRYNPDLIRVQGRGGITPLHYAVETDNIDLLIKFLLQCPYSINDLTVRFQTAMHIAVKTRNLRAFKVLFGWLDRSSNLTLLLWKDDQGNNVMHVAALTNQTEVIKLLRERQLCLRNHKNSQGKTPLDLIDPGNEEARKLLRTGIGEKANDEGSDIDWEGHLTCRRTLWESICKMYLFLVHLPSDNKNTIPVVVTLMATAAYQAALTPAADNSVSIIQQVANTVAFGYAMSTCFLLIIDNAVQFLWIALLLFCVSYAALRPSVTTIVTSIETILGLPAGGLLLFHHLPSMNDFFSLVIESSKDGRLRPIFSKYPDFK